MNKRTIFFLALLAGLTAPGCIKFAVTPGSSSLSIVNAINNSTALVTNFEQIGPKSVFKDTLQYYATAAEVLYASGWESGSYIGPTFLSLSDITDTSNVLWSGTLNLEVGSIHTLFLSGDTSAVDTLFTNDIIPYYPLSDSVVGIRIIDLSPGSLPICVNLQGNYPAQIDFSNLGYRQITSFKTYPANSTAFGSYIFEIRDQATGNLLSVWSWPYTLFKNNTLIIAGSESPNSPTPIIVFSMNNF